MKLPPTLLVFCIPVAFVVIGAVTRPSQLPTRYPVVHTQAEWLNDMNGKAFVSGVIHGSNIPANVAFTCDSILTAQYRDINSQVYQAMKADTLKRKP